VDKFMQNEFRLHEKNQQKYSRNETFGLLRTDRSENCGKLLEIQNYDQFGILVRCQEFLSLQWLYEWIHQHLHSVFQISLLNPYDSRSWVKTEF
jgi:hypothetical protein